MKSVHSVPFGAVCCYDGSCLTKVVLATATMRVTVFGSGFATFFQSVTTPMLVHTINSIAAPILSRHLHIQSRYVWRSMLAILL